MDSLKAHLLIEKLNLVFHSLKCAAKLKLTFDFFLKHLGDGSRRYHYPLKNNTVIQTRCNKRRFFKNQEVAEQR